LKTFFQGHGRRPELKEKLLSSSLNPGLHHPVRNMRAEADLFHESTCPAGRPAKYAIELTRSSAHRRSAGKRGSYADTSRFELPPVRSLPREKAWQLKAERQLSDRKSINELWRNSWTSAQGSPKMQASRPSVNILAAKIALDYTPTIASLLPSHRSCGCSGSDRDI